MLQKYTISIHATIRDAMVNIGDGRIGIVMVLDDDETLIGTLTDGDLRRMLLGGATLESPIRDNVNTNFTQVSPETARADVLDLMNARDIEQIPIVDTNGKLVGVHSIGSIVAKDTLPNWAVIMAGGKGTRLGELTQDTPKPMLKVAGRPILERIILHLVGSGIRKIYLAVNYLSHIIEDHFGNGSQFGCEIHYLHEDIPFGSGGALALLEEKPEHPLIVMNGDLVTDFHVRRMLDYHSRSGYLATMGLNYYNHQVPFGCVSIENGSIKALKEKPLLNELINCGIYTLSPELLDRIKPEFFPITNLFEDCLQKGEPLGGYIIKEEWADIGLPEELSSAQGKS